MLQSRAEELEHELTQADYEIRQLEEEVQMLRSELNEVKQVAGGETNNDANSNTERQAS